MRKKAPRGPDEKRDRKVCSGKKIIRKCKNKTKWNRKMQKLSSHNPLKRVEDKQGGSPVPSSPQSMILRGVSIEWLSLGMTAAR
jgi:hypothetical protein